MVERVTSKTIPTHVQHLAGKMGAFRAFLVSNGSAIHAPTNRYEVLRFDTPEGVGVIYKNTAERLSYVGGAMEAMICFLDARAWRGSARGKLSKTEGRRLRFMRSVADRDGWTCCYCAAELTEATATLEHFVSRTHGGPDHLANMMLAHGPCNSEASHLSVREKIELAVRMRAGKAESHYD